MNRSAAPIDLGTLLHTAHMAEAEVESALNEGGLTLAKLAALKVLSEAGESLPLTQLAERLSCVKSNITQLVDRLEADGLVQRQPAANDRRTRLAELTAAGRKACQEGMRRQREAERRVLGRLTVAEARQLAELLSKVGAT
jgi:DNA-binding MarR family transcriptional regulator